MFSEGFYLILPLVHGSLALSSTKHGLLRKYKKLSFPTLNEIAFAISLGLHCVSVLENMISGNSMLWIACGCTELCDISFFAPSEVIGSRAVSLWGFFFGLSYAR